jgi:general stress protein 26
MKTIFWFVVFVFSLTTQAQTRYEQFFNQFFATVENDKVKAHYSQTEEARSAIYFFSNDKSSLRKYNQITRKIKRVMNNTISIAPSLTSEINDNTSISTFQLPGNGDTINMKIFFRSNSNSHVVKEILYLKNGEPSTYVELSKDPSFEHYTVEVTHYYK